MIIPDNNKFVNELISNLKNILGNYNIEIIFNFPLIKYKYYLKNKHMIKNNIFVYVLEPLTDNDDLNYNKKMLKRLKSIPLNVISYSQVNLNILKNKLGNNRKYFLLPLNFYNYENFSFQKKINFLINHRDKVNYSASRKKIIIIQL